MRNAIRNKEGVGSYASILMPHCPVTVVQIYRDGVCSLLFHLFSIPISPSFDFYFYRFLVVPPRESNSDCTVMTLRY